MHFACFFVPLPNNRTNDIMNKIKSYAGVMLITAGTLTLILTRIPSLASSNGLLLTGLLFIVAGIVTHIWSIKHESNY